MKKQITIILGIILALPLVFAMIAGTNETIEFSGTVSECYIINNQSDLEGLNFVEQDNKVIISTDIKYKPDTFMISCLVQGQREVAEEESGGGGYYTYPWRNKVTIINETKEINYTEVLEETEEVTFDEEVIVEESKKFSRWWIVGIIILIMILIIIFTRSKPVEDFA